MSALATLFFTTTLTVTMSAALSRAEELNGSKIFVDSNCHSCHSVDTQGIEKRALPKIHGGDLSTIGDKRKKPDWMSSYLKGKKRGSNGLEHNVTPWVMPDGNRVIAKGLPNTVFAGTDEELEALATWLVTLKKGTAEEGDRNKDTETLTLEGEEWSLLVDLPGFSVNKRENSPNGSARMIQAYGKTGLMVSVFLERDPAPELDSMSDCRDYYWEKASNAYPFPVSDTKQVSTENMALVEWFVADGSSHTMKHVNAYMYRDHVCIDIHLSKTDYKAEDDSLFKSVLSSIRYSSE